MKRVKRGKTGRLEKNSLPQRSLVIGSLLVVLSVHGAGSTFLWGQTPAVPDDTGRVEITAEENTFSSTDVYPGMSDYTGLNFQQTAADPIPFTNNGQIGSEDRGLATLGASQIGLFTNNGSGSNVGSIYWTESLSFSALSNQDGRIQGANGIISVSGNVLNIGTAAVIDGTGTFQIGGALNNSAGAVIENVVSLTVGGDLTQTGTLLNNTNIAVTGNLFNTAGSISNGKNLTVGEDLSNAAEISNIDNIAVTGVMTNLGTIAGVSGTLSAVTKLINTASISDVAAITTSGMIANSDKITNVAQMTAGTVANNGTLDDVGTVVGDLQNNSGGTISLSDNAEMSVNGNLTSSGTLAFDINSTTGESGLFNVSGSAVIDGGTISVNDAAGTAGQYKANDSYKFLKSSDLSVAASPFINFQSTNLSPLLMVQGEYDEQNYYLKIARTREYAPGASTYNQTEFGGYLDDLGGNFVPGSDLENVLERLDALSPTEEISPEARQAMAELDGAVYGSLASIGIQHQTIVNQQLADALRPTLPGEYGCCPKKNLWGKYYRVDGDNEYDGNAFGGDNTINGVIAGIDGAMTEKFRFGGFFAYGQSDYSVNGLSESADTDSYKAGIYFVQADNNGYFIGNVNYGYDEYKVTRNITFLNRTCSGDTDGNQWAVRFEKGFNRSLGCTLIQPFGAFQFITFDRNGFSETDGGAASLEIEDSTYDSYRTDVGVRALWSRIFSQSQLVSVNIKGSWLHEFGDTCGTVVGQFSNPNSENFTGTVRPYTVRGSDTGRDWCNLGAGGNFTVRSVTLFAGYDFLFNDEQNLHTANAGLACRF